MLEGFNRLRKVNDSRMPIMYDTLVLIFKNLSQVYANIYEVRLFQAAYTLAFFGLFRVGELVFTSTFDSDRPLFITDVAFTCDKGAESLKVCLWKSKLIR